MQSLSTKPLNKIGGWVYYLSNTIRPEYDVSLLQGQVGRCLVERYNGPSTNAPQTVLDLMANKMCATNENARFTAYIIQRIFKFASFMLANKIEFRISDFYTPCPILYDKTCMYSFCSLPSIIYIHILHLTPGFAEADA